LDKEDHQQGQAGTRLPQETERIEEERPIHIQIGC
jgi:hypothetical protein